jgi:hypothetical protein
MFWMVGAHEGEEETDLHWLGANRLNNEVGD